MTPREAWTNHVATVLVGASGLVYGWMRYLVRPDDPYAIANHPLQPTMQHAHVVLAPLLVFAAGLVWRNHVWKRVRSGFRQRRRSGLVLAASLFPMIASGYLLQVAEDEGWRWTWIVVHVATSLAWVLAYGLHQLSARRSVAEQGS